MLKALLIVLTLPLLTISASAETITSGSAGLSYSSGFVRGVMNFSGPNFSVYGGGRNLVGFGSVPCLGEGDIGVCASGNIIQLSAKSGSWSMGDMWGSMTIDGKGYTFGSTGIGYIEFTGGSATIPFNGSSTIILSAPFSMRGYLRSGIYPIVGLGLSGSGTAQLILNKMANGQYNFEGISYTFTMPVLSVAVDIKPGDYPNAIHLVESGGTVPVAILSTTAFDASLIDPVTVTVAGAPVKLKPNGRPMSSLEDVNGDGLLDLIVHVWTEALQLTNIDSEAQVQGKTFDREWMIRGSDSIVVVP